MHLPEAVTSAIARGAGKRSIKFVVIHTQGTPGGDHESSWASVRAFHMAAPPKGNGWRDGGYNFFVRKSGLVEIGRPLEQIPAHVAGFNADTIGVCFAGNGDISDFSLAQYDAGIPLLRALGEQFDLDWWRIIGHREAPAHGAPPTGKTCPGKCVDMDRLRARLVGAA
jgi:hypothetical protein